MAHNATTALELLKGRMNRAGVDTPAPLVSIWTMRIDAAARELTKKGIHLEDTSDDNALVADLAYESITNPDKPETPKWLSQKITQRWFQERPVSTE